MKAVFTRSLPPYVNCISSLSKIKRTMFRMAIDLRFTDGATVTASLLNSDSLFSECFSTKCIINFDDYRNS